jgi:hypothetical protein
MGTSFLNAAETSNRDATYFACDNVLEEGFENAEFSNYMYLSGLANGIIFGARNAYTRHDVAEALPQSPNWSQMILDSCKVAIEDISERRSLDVFREDFFNTLIELGANGA